MRTRIRIYGSESGAALTHGLSWTFCGFFADFLDSILYLEDMLRCVCEEGDGTASVKIWIKIRKIVGSATLLFKLRSSFYTSRGGGSEAPIRRIARWGL
jgi:hypothetical protein